MHLAYYQLRLLSSTAPIERHRDHREIHAPKPDRARRAIWASQYGAQFGRHTMARDLAPQGQ